MTDLKKYFASAVFVCMMFVLVIPLSSATHPDNIFILGGQSNMAGRGGVRKNPITNIKEWDGYIPKEFRSRKSILRFNARMKWEHAHEPLHRDIDVQKVNGVGPGMPFANELLKKASNNIGVIGLVPCAIGGTHLREWVKGTANYTKLIKRIQTSQKHGGKLQAFLWFQGESDASVEEESKCYEGNLTKFFTDLRKDLNHPRLPIIQVKIITHDFFTSPILNWKEVVWNAQEAVTRKLPNVRMVDAMKAVRSFKTGLNEDKGHLNVKSLERLGKMMARTFYSNFGCNLTRKKVPKNDS